ncbi:hypothetical protein WJX72_011576 [[Myrmecia] bisecta]|uniref:CBS domain-containing protein n=1 Tax=[Myrmecia] bisecta TaxID=41462 RepID=A0AAW1PI48_9CHLO
MAGVLQCSDLVTQTGRHSRQQSSHSCSTSAPLRAPQRSPAAGGIVGAHSRATVVLPRRNVAPLAAVASERPPSFVPRAPECVEDVMTRGKIYQCREDTTVDEALEMMVRNKITGLPVVDRDNRVIGVVSDYDLLSLDGISGKMQKTGMFPDTSMEWKAFHEVQKLVVKNAGKLVSDVMTPDPLVVRPHTNVEAAARILLERKVRRLPVVDDDGKLVGIFTRGDVIKAALANRRAAQGL